MFFAEKYMKIENKKKEDEALTTRTLGVPAVNNHGGFGRWAFVEIFDTWDTKNTIDGLSKKENV